jgi:predicted RecB family nuclease
MQKHADGTVVVSATDLVGYLACDHLATLEMERIAGLRRKPDRHDPELELLQERGDRHERDHLERLRAAGRSIVEIPEGLRSARDPDELRAAAEATRLAMESGADVVFQATFFDGRWRGHADFLVRAERPSRLGSWSYDVADTKLARHVKASALIQMCVYADLLERVQGVPPETLTVVTGDGTSHHHRYTDFAAFHRLVKGRFEERVFGPAATAPTYPDPVDHCRVCGWWLTCVERREADDHLSLVAGMSRTATERFVEAGIATLERLGQTPAAASVSEMAPATFARLQGQAAIQLDGRRSGRLEYELLPPDPEQPVHGLGALPEPSLLDVFFDIEADPWIGDTGLEYLLGWSEIVAGEDRYHTIWAHDRGQEKVAFEAFIDAIVDRLERDPGMHVYHYAAYEKTALRRLVGRYATREDELDRILRAGVLVDLYQVVRQGLRASVGSYSLKQIEHFYLGQREGPITRAGFSVVEYERWLGDGDEQHLRDLADYNRDDCVSTRGLRDWLESLRLEAQVQFGRPLARPSLGTGLPSEAQVEIAEDTRRRIAALTGGLSVDPTARAEEESARWLLAGLLDWHRRDARQGWWDYFRLRELPLDDLIGETEPLGGLEYEGVVGEVKNSFIHRLTFPPQDHKVTPGSDNWEDDYGRGVTVHAIDDEHGVLDIRRAKNSDAPPPRALLKGTPPDPKYLRSALGRVADAVIRGGIDGPGPYRAIRDLLLRRPTRLRPDGGAVLDSAANPNRPIVGLARDLALDLPAAATVLSIQGPPGTGKTFTGARMIVELVRTGHRVGISAQAHKAITNLLAETIGAGHNDGVPIRAIQRVDAGQGAGEFEEVTEGSNDDVVKGLAGGTVDVVAGTSWLFARPELDGTLDVLFVDEAGQQSLANTVAAATAARSIVLLGDPNQLPQVSQGTHPDGAGASALEHVLGDSRTLPPDRGLFLPVTYRMHPRVNGYVSELFYERRLATDPSTAHQAIAGPGTGIRYMPVTHPGDGSRSTAEAEAVAGLVAGLVGRAWTDRFDAVRQLGLADILVVAPYNAHVAEVHAAIERRLGPGARVGTVDKFQGQEAPVAIFTTATSSPDELPRDMEFLYSGNRLNVAVSRARGLAILVSSPDLLRVACRTAEQMKMVNAFCRLVEVAGEQAATSTAERIVSPG